MDPLLNVKQVAEIWNVAVWTVRLWMRLGRFSYVRLGKRVLVEPRVVLDFIERGKKNTGSARGR